MILHPLTTLVFWYEFGALAFADQDSALSFIIDRTLSAFAFEMFAMSLIYAAIGGAIGLGFGVYHVRLVHERSRVRFLERELNEELPLLIARGESEQLEFKSSFRWDRRQEKVNRSLQQVIVKTLAGFLNQEGGTLLIGVEDDGSIAGIEADTAKEGLGGHACALIHCRFHKLEEKIVCRVIVEKSLEPIYFSEGSVARFMLRAGNSTRELDVREAQAYLQHRGKVSI